MANILVALALDHGDSVDTKELRKIVARHCSSGSFDEIYPLVNEFVSNIAWSESYRGQIRDRYRRYFKERCDLARTYFWTCGGFIIIPAILALIKPSWYPLPIQYILLLGVGLFGTVVFIAVFALPKPYPRKLVAFDVRISLIEGHGVLWKDDDQHYLEQVFL